MINIYTYAFNNAKYLQYQAELLMKYCQDEFQFTCVDNSKDPIARQRLIDVCRKYGIRHEIVPAPDHSLAGLSHATAIQYSYHVFMEHSSDYAMLLDHDMFPIYYFSPEKILANHEFAGAAQSNQHVSYLHPSCIMINLANLPNKNLISFHGNKIDDINVDTGGQLHKYFTDNPSVRVRHLACGLVPKEHFLIPEGMKDYYNQDAPFDIVEGKLLHTRLGSGWYPMPALEFDRRNQLIYTILDGALHETT